jgi:hypothetical protein
LVGKFQSEEAIDMLGCRSDIVKANSVQRLDARDAEERAAITDDVEAQAPGSFAM